MKEAINILRKALDPIKGPDSVVAARKAPRHIHLWAEGDGVRIRHDIDTHHPDSWHSPAAHKEYQLLSQPEHRYRGWGVDLSSNSSLGPLSSIREPPKFKRAKMLFPFHPGFEESVKAVEVGSPGFKTVIHRNPHYDPKVAWSPHEEDRRTFPWSSTIVNTNKGSVLDEWHHNSLHAAIKQHRGLKDSFITKIHYHDDK